MTFVHWPQEMVLDKTKEGIRPRYLIYDIVQFEVCDLRGTLLRKEDISFLCTFLPPPLPRVVQKWPSATTRGDSCVCRRSSLNQEMLL